ncbi:MAG: hypothetical protein GSR80_000046 [Desulfurococcales archaeon]|nr:hypothetical protein [Desulfurococcales archaeon]
MKRLALAVLLALTALAPLAVLESAAAASTHYVMYVLHVIEPYNATTTTWKPGNLLCDDKVISKTYLYYFELKPLSDGVAFASPVIGNQSAAAALTVEPDGSVGFADVIVVLGTGSTVPVKVAIRDTYETRVCISGYRSWARHITITYYLPGQEKSFTLYWKPLGANATEQPPWSFGDRPAVKIGVIVPYGAQIGDPLVYAGKPPTPAQTATTTATQTITQPITIPKTPEPEPAPTLTILPNGSTSWIQPKPSAGNAAGNASSASGAGSAQPGARSPSRGYAALGVGAVVVLAFLLLAKR